MVAPVAKAAAEAAWPEGKDEVHVAYERRAAFRNAEDDGGNLTLWVINCREPRGS